MEKVLFVLLLLPSMVLAASFGPVKSGEHLYRIALDNKSATVTVEQAMVSIYQTNPAAFQGNMNDLLVGSTLYIPRREEMLKLSQAQAVQMIQQQNDIQESLQAKNAGKPTYNVYPIFDLKQST